MIQILLSVASYYLAIGLLKSYKQPIREDGPKHHHRKDKTPTMGGLVTVVGTLLQFLYYGYLWHPIGLTLMSYGCLGLYDDVKKIYAKNNYGGILPRFKFILQWILAFLILKSIPLDTTLYVLGYTIGLGQWYVLFASFMMVASSNAFNLTDGLDGLAATQGLLLLFGFGVVATSKGDMVLVTIITALWVMLFGFFWVNRYPARLFMGDVGSLPIGAVLGLLAVLLKVEVAFALASIVLVGETLSVILQVLFFKLGYGRIFKMAPFHHHLELSGWHETEIVKMAFFLTSVMLYVASYAIQFIK